jgi:hypothetical protein
VLYFNAAMLPSFGAEQHLRGFVKDKETGSLLVRNPPYVRGETDTTVPDKCRIRCLDR